MNITLPAPRPLAHRLLWTVATLHVLSLGCNAVYHGLGIHDPFPRFTWLTVFFNVDKEKNLPTWFSSTVLLLAAFVLWEIATTEKASGDRYARHWRILSVVFVVLSLDEVTQAHELASRSGILNLGAASYLSWIVVVAPLVIVFAVSYLRFLAHLPAKTRQLIVAAGCIYVGGAAGMEIVGAFIDRNLTVEIQPGLTGQIPGGPPYFRYLLAASAEELMEMLGSILFLYTVASHLQQRRNPAPSNRIISTRMPTETASADAPVSTVG